jgi:AbrB family looped-hinge helix DNA binding protein
MPTAKVTSKGQITIPIEVRKALKLKTGDRIDFYEGEDGRFVLQPKNGSVKELRGILKKMGYAPLGYTPSIEEMDQDILDYAAELDEATMSDEARARKVRQSA